MKEMDGEKIGYVVSGNYKNMDVYYFFDENVVLIGEIKGAVCQSRFYFYKRIGEDKQGSVSVFISDFIAPLNENSAKQYIVDIAFPDGERSAIITDENGLGYIKNALKCS